MYRWWLTFLVCTLVFLIPSNLFLAFPLGTEYIHGLRVDYLIPKLYASDLVVLLIIASYFVKIKLAGLKNLSKKLFGGRSNSYVLINVIIIIFVALRQIVTPIALVGLLTLLRFCSCIILMLVLLQLVRLIKRSCLMLALAGTVFFQSCVALHQWVTQQSVYGYSFLGEVNLHFSLGLAKTVWWGKEMILPYGTTAHPNVLGGVIAIYLIAIVFWLSNQKTSLTQKFFYMSIIAFGAIVLLMTQSVSAVMAIGIGSVLVLHTKFMLRKSQALPYIKARLFWFIFILSSVVGVVLVQAGSTFYTTNDSLVRRERLNSAALEMILQRPVFGVGLSNFTINLDQSVSHGKVIVPFLQPVHNVLLLLIAEAGGLGLAAIMTVKYLVQGSKSQQEHFGWFGSKISLLYLTLLPIAVLDHYLITLQSGLLMLAIVPYLIPIDQVEV